MMSYYTLKLLAEAHQADLLRQAQPRTVAPRRNLWRPILRIGRSTESPKRGLPWSPDEEAGTEAKGGVI